MCKVSILVPVYNVRKYLEQCLDSLAAQTLESIEFLCIDDGSTDGCSEILDDYAKKDAHFHVIHKANSGYGASMNVGLRAARGEYIGIVESDDFAEPEMFQALYTVAKQQDVDVVKSNYYEHQNGEDKFEEVLRGHDYGVVFCPRKEKSEFLIETPSIWSCIYRRTFLLENEIWFNETPGASYQDTSFVFLTKAYADRFFLVREGYLHYRMDNEQASSHSTGKIYSLIEEYDAVERYLVAHEISESLWLHTMSAKLFYRNFGFTEGRISPKMHPLFWMKAYPKLVIAKEHGYFHEDLDESMGAWMLKRFMNQQKKEFFIEGFRRLCTSGPHCYLCGAGKVAKQLLGGMRRNHFEITGFIVSDASKNPASVESLPVYAMDASPADRDRDAVVLAVSPRKPAVQQEIFLALERAGYRNVIVLTEELLRALT